MLSKLDAVVFHPRVAKATGVRDVFEEEIGVNALVIAACSCSPCVDHARDAAHRPHAFVFAVLPLPIIVVVDDVVEFSVNVEHPHVALQFACLRSDGHGSCEGRNGGKPVVELACNFVGEHGAQRIANGVQPVFIDAIGQCEFIDDGFSEVVVLPRRCCSVKEPLPFGCSPVVFCNGVGHDELLILCELVKFGLLLKIPAVVVATVKRDHDRKRRPGG